MSDETTPAMDSERPTSSFIIPAWAAIFRALSFISLFWLLRWAIPWLRDKTRAYAVVEFWVLGHTVLAFGVALLAYASPSPRLVSIFLLYGAIRVFEIVITQGNVLLFDEWRARRASQPYSLRGYRRILILLLHNYAEVVFWFMAALLAFHHRSYLALDDPSFSTVFRTTLLSMVTFSSEGVRAPYWYASVLLTIQSLVGVFMTVLTLARFLSLIPTPATQEPTERG